jgi:hypothetical protein
MADDGLVRAVHRSQGRRRNSRWARLPLRQSVELPALEQVLSDLPRRRATTGRGTIAVDAEVDPWSQEDERNVAFQA